MSANRRRLFLLTGKAGAGKDTVADYLVNQHNFVKFNFATTMKEYASKIYNIDLAYFYDRDKKDSPLPFKVQTQSNKSVVTPRDVLIEYAAKTRSEDPDYWSKVLLKEMQKQQDTTNRFVIADCRLRSEIAFMKSQGYFDEVLLVWVSRSTENIADNIELSTEDADVVVHNESSPFDPDQIYKSLKGYL
jgi:hypothetical protein